MKKGQTRNQAEKWGFSKSLYVSMALHAWSCWCREFGTCWRLTFSCRTTYMEQAMPSYTDRQAGKSSQFYQLQAVWLANNVGKFPNTESKFTIYKWYIYTFWKFSQKCPSVLEYFLHLCNTIYLCGCKHIYMVWYKFGSLSDWWLVSFML